MNLTLAVTASVASDFSMVDNPTGLNRAAGYEVYLVVRAHLRMIGLNRHATANWLGAKPTKFWSTTARTVSFASATMEGFEIGVPNPAIGQAFHDVTIVPKRAKALTIPISALSYGKTVYEMSRKFKIFRPKGKSVLCGKTGRGKTAKLVPLFALVKQVHLRRDASLFPDDLAINEAASRGANKFMRLAGRMGGGSNVVPA